MHHLLKLENKINDRAYSVFILRLVEKMWQAGLFKCYDCSVVESMEYQECLKLAFRCSQDISILMLQRGILCNASNLQLATGGTKYCAILQLSNRAGMGMYFDGSRVHLNPYWNALSPYVVGQEVYYLNENTYEHTVIIATKQSRFPSNRPVYQIHVTEDGVRKPQWRRHDRLVPILEPIQVGETLSMLFGKRDFKWVVTNISPNRMFYTVKEKLRMTIRKKKLLSGGSCAER